MKRHWIYVLSAVCLAAMAACAGHGPQAELQDSNGKLQYAPPVNEVTVITLKRQDFPMQLISNGKLSAASRTSLSFKESGTVKEVLVQNGQHVTKGTVIAVLDDSEQRSALESARIELDRTAIDLQDALVGLGYSVSGPDSVPEDVKKMASIRSGFSAAQNDYAKARMALDRTVLKAPFDGRVADLKLKAWDSASSSDPFCTVIGDDGFDVDFTILESEYSFVEKGQNVSVSRFGDSRTDCVIGRITSINPVVDKNGQISVRAHVASSSGMLDGMNVRVTVEKMLGRQLVVPKKAVVIRDGLEVLFRYNGQGTAEWVYVHTLQENSESYAVEANEERAATLSEGDIVIVSGNLNLADGSKVALKRQE